MQHCVNHTWDIPQAYEMIKRSTLKKDVHNLLMIAQRTKNGLQQVYSCAKAVSCHTRSFHRDRDDAVVLASKTIEKSVDAYTEFRLYRVGNVLVQQNDGTPIGGFLSSTLLHVHLATAENNFIKYKWPEIAKKHNLSPD
eukprot:9746909-Karenia_brevis.AAC.1